MSFSRPSAFQSHEIVPPIQFDRSPSKAAGATKSKATPPWRIERRHEAAGISIARRVDERVRAVVLHGPSPCVRVEAALDRRSQRPHELDSVDGAAAEQAVRVGDEGARNRERTAGNAETHMTDGDVVAAAAFVEEDARERGVADDAQEGVGLVADRADERSVVRRRALLDGAHSLVGRPVVADHEDAERASRTVGEANLEVVVLEVVDVAERERVGTEDGRAALHVLEDEARAALLHLELEARRETRRSRVEAERGTEVLVVRGRRPDLVGQRQMGRRRVEALDRESERCDGGLPSRLVCKELDVRSRRRSDQDACDGEQHESRADHRRAPRRADAPSDASARDVSHS